MLRRVQPIWLVPLAVVAAGGAARNGAMVALGAGLAGGLSLSGSV